MEQFLLSERSVRRWLLVLLCFAAAAGLFGGAGMFFSPETMAAVIERFGGAVLPAVLLIVLIALPQGVSAATVFAGKGARILRLCIAVELAACMLAACFLFSWAPTVILYLVLALLEVWLVLRHDDVIGPPDRSKEE